MNISGVTGVEASYGPASPAVTSASSTSQPDSSAAASPASSNVYYPSPITTLDPVTGALIQEWRDPGTGDELYQSPTRTALLYGKAQDSASPPSSEASSGGQAGTPNAGGVSRLT